MPVFIAGSVVQLGINTPARLLVVRADVGISMPCGFMGTSASRKAPSQ